ncbi:FHA domain-containing protein [Promicromonospora sp. NPDC057488]|uniref:FHA domain-containing protein n=1 Tax=Promicromonospora sp. NPDC057488 TaxID=3346147 RepID=UPI003670CC3D
MTGARPATASLSAGLVAASGGERARAVAVDVGLVVLAAVPAVLGSAGVWPPTVGVPLGLVLTAGVVVLLIRELRTTGGTPGALATRTRYVDALLGTPPGRSGGPRIALVRLDERRAAPAPRPTPTRPASAPAPAPAPTLTARLIDGAERIEVLGSALLGRRPAPRPGEAVGDVVQIADPTRSVSSTHALLTWDGATLWLTDRGSTNGSWVVGTDGERQRAEPGVPLAVPAGGTVQLGNRALRVEVS